MPVLGTKGGELDLLLKQGSTFGPHQITLKDSANQAINITGATIRAQIRKTSDAATAVATGDFVITNGAGVWQSGTSTPAGSGGTQTLKLYEEGGAIKCFVDGTQIFSFTDPTPITTGSPGFSMNTSSESATRMLSWKDFN